MAKSWSTCTNKNQEVVEDWKQSLQHAWQFQCQGCLQSDNRQFIHFHADFEDMKLFVESFIDPIWPCSVLKALKLSFYPSCGGQTQTSTGQLQIASVYAWWCPPMWRSLLAANQFEGTWPPKDLIQEKKRTILSGVPWNFYDTKIFKVAFQGNLETVPRTLESSITL